MASSGATDNRDPRAAGSAVIGVDWGTSRFRAYRMAADGRVLERREAELGAALLAPADFPAVLQREIGPWLEADDAPVVLSGMVGSRQGWHEVPYLACPVDARAIARAAQAVALPNGRAWIVPGLSCRDVAGRADVLRGEETQILGLLPELPAGRSTVCLPGTHSKWAVVEDGRIEGFRTFMTGELYDLLLHRSMVGRLAVAGEAADDAFAAGLDRAGEAAALSHKLFGIRAAVLAGDLAPTALAAFLSGLLIGDELAAAPPGGPVHLVGEAGLVARYSRALELRGTTAVVHGGEPAARGLWQIGRMLG